MASAQASEIPGKRGYILFGSRDVNRVHFLCVGWGDGGCIAGACVRVRARVCVMREGG